MILYRNYLKNRELDKEAPQNFHLERATIVLHQDASEDENFEEKQTPSKTDFSSSFGIFTIPAILCLISSSLLGATATPKEEPANEMPPPHLKSSSTSSYISIPIKDRALDLQQAFDLLKKEKTTGKVYFQFSDGSTISNIINMTLLPNNSLILFRYNSNNQGIRLQVVKVEDIVGLSYY